MMMLMMMMVIIIIIIIIIIARYVHWRLCEKYGLKKKRPLNDTSRTQKVSLRIIGLNHAAAMLSPEGMKTSVFTHRNSFANTSTRGSGYEIYGSPRSSYKVSPDWRPPLPLTKEQITETMDPRPKTKGLGFNNVN